METRQHKNRFSNNRPGSNRSNNNPHPRPQNSHQQHVAVKTPLDEARDELFQHIMRCGVIGSAPEHQAEWFDETFVYLKDRYPELNQKSLSELRVLGERFAQPPKAKQAV